MTLNWGKHSGQFFLATVSPSAALEAQVVFPLIAQSILRRLYVIQCFKIKDDVKKLKSQFNQASPRLQAKRDTRVLKI